MLKKIVAHVFFAVITFWGINAHASIIMDTTRIIFTQEKGESFAQLTNKGNTPLLVQAWIDDGDANADPSTIQVPFSITPSTVRVDPEKGQVIRIFELNSNLPQDRESLFWFNLMEVPPIQANLAAERNFLQIAIRTRIKLFYRPTTLTISSEKAYDLLSFKVTQAANGYQIVINNPSAYHINFSQLGLRLPDQTIVSAQMNSVESKIIAPFTEVMIPIPELRSTPPIGTKFFYLIINDSGGTTSGGGIVSISNN